MNWHKVIFMESKMSVELTDASKLDAKKILETSTDIQKLIASFKVLVEVKSPAVSKIKHPEALFLALTELDNMIQMKSIKKSIIHQLKYLLISHEHSSERESLLKSDPGLNSNQNSKHDQKVTNIIDKNLSDTGLLNPNSSSAFRSLNFKSGSSSIFSSSSSSSSSCCEDKKCDSNKRNLAKSTGNIESKNTFNGHMLHTVIYGPPGVGKTQVGIILAKIWSSLGLLKPAPATIKKCPDDIIAVLKEKILKNNITYLKNLVISYQRRMNRINQSAKKDRQIANKVRNSLRIIQRKVHKQTQKSKIHLRNRSTIINVNNNDSEMDIDYSGCPTSFGKQPEYHKNITKSDTKNKDNFPSNSSNQNRNDLADRTEERINDLVLDSGDIAYTMDDIILDSVVDPKDLLEEEEKIEDASIITVVNRSDFVAEYVGQTAIKTRELLESNLGKVVFIDEAYSLINGERDTFGMEALTILNQFMSEHSDEIIIIFAGYKNLMQKTIFNAQPGLRRRCAWVFDVESYTAEGLADIFKIQSVKNGWNICPTVNLVDFFKKNIEKFPSFGGDTNRLLFHCGLEYSNVKFEEAFISASSNTSFLIDRILTEAIMVEALKSLSSNDAEFSTFDSKPPPGLYM